MEIQEGNAVPKQDEIIQEAQQGHADLGALYELTADQRLAMQLADKPELYQEIQGFNQETLRKQDELLNKVSELQSGLDTRDSELIALKQKVAMLTDYNANLLQQNMRNTQLNTFAALQTKHDPLEQFKADLDRSGQFKKWDV